MGVVTLTEPLGLLPSAQELRSAAILTKAGMTNGLVAGDVGVCSPEASGAGLDCVEAMNQHKLNKIWRTRADGAQKSRTCSTHP